MNSEELEMSLRSEFEIYLKDVLAGMRQEFSQFQEKIEAEFDKHKSQLDTVFQEFSTRFDTENQLEQSFKETVVEHLRLARDEGARITATAIAEAEDMQKQSAPTEDLSKPFAAPTVSISQLRDSINDITSQDSQGTILKSLVQNAAKYTPRGAFFIIKNEHFVGWRIFNKEGEADENAVREVYLPVASESVLGESVRSLSAVESSFGTYADDAEYLSQIGFGEPERMIAIPLVARGRGVAVLYADYGTQDEQVNVEALETLVRVAGLTVEVLAAAASQPAKHTPTEATPPSNYVQPVSDEASAEQVEESQAEESTEFAAPETPETPEVSESSEIAEASETVETDSESYAPVAQHSENSYKETPRPDAAQPEDFSRPEETVSQSKDDQDQEYSGEIIEDAQVISVEPNAVEDEDSSEISERNATEESYSPPVSTDFQFTESSSIVEKPTVSNFDNSNFGNKSFEAVPPVSAPAEVPRSFEKSNGSPATYTPQPSAGEKISGAPVRSRFGDRNVDLPIEVSEDERRLHNDARRFARLLVSEIKLYNEQKVKEGREARDLYDRLREAIDRSRDMYNKRVQPPVADKFDYFHYELVSTLAEGEANKLGGDYPGATT